MTKRWLTVKEAQEYLGISRNTLLKHYGNCISPKSRRNGGKLLFDREKIDTENTRDAVSDKVALTVNRLKGFCT